jgi:hypothetical protein
MNIYTRLRSIGWRPLAAIALAAVGLAGCSGSGGGSATLNSPASGCTSASCGTLLVGVKDADGDFISYSVDVQSITLQRASGATVEVLPATTTVDFAQLTDFSDLLSAATLASGDFVGGTIRVDFSNAAVFVEVGGQAVKANVVDANGQPLGVTDLKIQLSNRDHLILTPGRVTFLTLDFDLMASNTVDTTQSPPVVTASPFIVAEVEPAAQRDLRLRGALVSTDVAASTYTVDVRPWFRKDGNHGRVTVHTTPTTSFEINGDASEGDAGLTALAALPAGTMTVAFGAVSTGDRTFTATTVQAGDSVSGVGLDAVHGNVVSRTDTQLTVKGAFAVRHDHDAGLLRTVQIDVGPDTKVLKTGDPTQVLTSAAISVGQHIVAFGAFKDATTTTPATLDATAGRVRLLPTHVVGSVNSLVAGQLNLNLRAIDRLGVDMFDFTGTGTSATTDADPTDYEVSTGTLSLSSLTTGETAKVLGFVTPFGAAPPDFEGRTVIDPADLPDVLSIGWGFSGTTTPFLSLDATGISVDLTNTSIGARHHVFSDWQRIDLLTPPTSLTIVPASDPVLFGIAKRGNIELFTSFADLVAAITTHLNAGDAAVSLTASGSYDSGTGTLTANRISVFFTSTN